MKSITISRNKISRSFRLFSLGMAMTLFFELAFPTLSLALTSGPGQPEYSSFEPASTSDMVDVYSGGFTYNIPLLSVPGPNGGYPINLAYQSGIGMDQEASWVGLGWVLNVGALNRQLQGIPDDFKNEDMEYRVYQKKTWSVSADLPISSRQHNEILGAPVGPASSSAWSFGTQLYYNNYRGLGYRVSVNWSKFDNEEKKSAPFSLGLSFDSQNGIGINPSVSVQGKLSMQLSAGYNSRTGLNGVNFTMSPNFIMSKRLNKKIAQANGIIAKHNIQQAAVAQMKGSGDASFFSASSQVANRRVAAYPSSSGLTFSFDGRVTNIGIETKTSYFPITIRARGNAPVWPVFNASEPNSLWSGMYSTTDLPKTEYTDKAFGYLYSKDGQAEAGEEGKDDEVVRDYTKKDIQYSKKVPNLSPSKGTYDVFIFSGQGTGGFFRPYSNDVDVYAEKRKTSTTVTNDITAEYGDTTSVTPPFHNVHAGIGYNRQKGISTEGDWEDADSYSDFNLVPDRQTTMKLAGEQTGVLYDQDLLEKYWGGDRAVRNNLDDNHLYIGREYQLENDLVYYQGGTGPANGNISTYPDLQYKRYADNRNTSVRYLTGLEASQYGYSKSVEYTDYTAGGAPVVDKSFARPGHHISEIVVTQPEGSKYIYGLPVYNEKQQEFSYNKNTVYSASNPLISAPDEGDENMDLVKEDLDANYTKFYQKSSTKPYAYSWLLTGVLGSDYIDVTQDGITDDDKGYWVRFTYAKTNDAFKWRVPYTGAKLSENAYKNEYDNVASFTYGEKEIYYVEKIETKTHIAIFELEDREDALSAKGAFDGGTSTEKQKRLKSIKLYSRGDMDTPLQVVHFEYDYSLCPGVPNHSATVTPGVPVTVSGKPVNGKLTLKKVYFTYEKSAKGALSPYEFTYSTSNPSYNELAVDRWGNYKDVSIGSGAASDPYPYERFPYTEQKSAPVADAWHLVGIQLPTGGDLNIEYESNDYAYVEGEPAMHMFDIVGIGNELDGSGVMQDNWEGSSDNAWYDTPSNTSTPGAYPERNTGAGSPKVFTKLENENGAGNGYRVYFELDKPYSTTDYNTEAKRAALVREKFLQYKQKIWFKNLTRLKSNITDVFDDYVEGYADIQYTVQTGYTEGHYFGLCKSGSASTGYDVGYFTLVREPLQENGLGWSKANPMTRLALQHMRMNRDDISYSAYPSLADGSPIDTYMSLLYSIPSFIAEIYGMIASYNVSQFSLGNCKFIQLNGHSKVRLYDADGHKYGGGSRVKKLTIEDNWASGSGAVDGEEGVYGQKYVYNMSGIDGDETSESSGVAYEPFVGAEESALRQPIEYSQSTPLRSSYSLFVEKPVLDFYYPGASVGYRKVTVYSLGKENAAVEAGSADVNHSAAAPATVYEFYTPRDFPVYSDQTDINPEQTHLVPVIVPGIYSYFEAKKARSQGYSIVLNDMAGKLRRISQFKVTNDNKPTGGLISSMEYIYKTETPFKEEGQNRLSSIVQLVVPGTGLEPEIKTGILGQTTDIHQERHESRYSEIGYGLEGNIDATTSVALTLATPMIYPSFQQKVTSMKTVTINKVIHRSGILVKTVAKTDQSVITTENLAYDMYTGEPVLTRSNNEYDDHVYNFSYPGYWYYPNLKPAQQNDYFVMTGISLTVGSEGEVTLPTTLTYSVDDLTVGDELYLGTVGSSGPPPANNIAHVAKVDYGANKIWLMDKYGYYLNNGVNIVSIRCRNSGFKNMQAAGVGALTFKNLSGYTTNLLAAGSAYGSSSVLGFGKVINTAAIEFSQNWQSDCSDCEERPEGEDPQQHPVVNPFLAGILNQWRPKKQYAYHTERIYTSHSRDEGYLADYTRFKWEDPSTSSNKWVVGNTVTKYSPYGFELENKDALNNYSCAHYGYKNALLTSLASNSRYEESMAENFEDYYAGTDCFSNKLLVCAIPGVNSSIISAIVTDDQKHSGKYALWPNGAYTSVPFTGKVGELSNCDGRNDSIAPRTIEVGESLPGYELDACDCLGKMKLMADGSYVFSAWTKVVKDWSSSGKPYTYDEPEVVIDFYDASNALITGQSVTIETNTKNKIIEGWQRLYQEFHVPAIAASFKVTFKKSTTDTGTEVYYDDFRIHPFDANMAAYVYDAATLKLLAELDANNYATFYAYDEEGNLIHLKKETTEGIKTISEGRKELQKQNP